MSKEKTISKALYDLDEEVFKNEALKPLLEHCKLYQGCADPRVYETAKTLLKQAKTSDIVYKVCSGLIIDALYI